MKARYMCDGVQWLGAVDWNRRLFDALIPLPDGTSYNAYLVKGSEKTALLDAVDPSMEDVLLKQLDGVDRIDYLVSHHAEQDHTGAISAVLERYPDAIILCSPRAKDMLVDHLHICAESIRTVADGEELSLGNKTLRFIHTPWVHWPETMSTYLPEDRILFSCDLFGSHLATSELYAGDDPIVAEAAKRYYGEIMMPFRSAIRSNLDKLRGLDIGMIAPSHGPVFDIPQVIFSAYEEWVSDRVVNSVVLPYTSMHGSTEAMARHLIGLFEERGIAVHPFELSTTDLGKLAMALVDAATIVIGTPTVLIGPHPNVYGAVHLANALKPKVRHAAVFGSYGWGTKVVEQLTALIPNLKVEVLGAVMCKGLPRETTFAELDALADKIREKHQLLGIC